MSSVKESSRSSHVNRSLNQSTNIGSTAPNYVPYNRNRVTNEKIKEQQVIFSSYLIKVNRN